MWGFCAHKAKIVSVWSSLENIISLFHRPKGDHFSYLDYLIATEGELEAELVWASKRPKSKALGMTIPEIKKLDRPFWSCLTATLG